MYITVEQRSLLRFSRTRDKDAYKYKRFAMAEAISRTVRSNIRHGNSSNIHTFYHSQETRKICGRKFD